RRQVERRLKAGVGVGGGAPQLRYDLRRSHSPCVPDLGGHDQTAAVQSERGLWLRRAAARPPAAGTPPGPPPPPAPRDRSRPPRRASRRPAASGSNAASCVAARTPPP